MSARELAQASLDRIEATEQLNHWTLVDAEGALAAADAIKPGDERPFAGVPLGLKDLFLPVNGMRMTQGSDIVPDFVPDYDAAVVRRFRDAGFVFMGRTQSPEFGILPVTEPRRFGPCRNPWDPERTTGGSSGGSGGAVAAGAVPVGHASDGGGSIRIPAACNGLVGLKPSRGRISSAPDLGDQMLATNGALTRTVADSAAVLDVLAGYEPGDATWASPPEAPFADLAGRDPGKLRIALTLDLPVESELDPQYEQAARDTAKLLEELGHHVEEVDAPWKGVDLLPTFSVLWAANVSASVTFSGMLGGREPGPDTIEPLSMWLYETGRSITAPDYLLAVGQLQAFSRGVVGFFGDWDVILTPSLAKLPGAPRRDRPDGREPGVRVQEVGRVHALHRRPERDRPARDLAAAGPERGGPAAGLPADRPARGRGRPAGAVGAAGAAPSPWADRLAPEL